MAKTKFVQIDAYLQWARIFYENRDTKSTHKGVQKYLDKYDGEYKVSVIPATEEDFDKVKSLLTDKMYGGADRYKKVDGDLGVGYSFQLSRRHSDKQTFKDRETGEKREVDFGGEPELVWFNDEKGKNTPWDKETDGFVGNGTFAKVKFSIYGEDTPSVSDTLRLEKIGVVNHIPYDNSGNSGDRF